MWRTDLLEKTLMLGKIVGRKRREWQRWDGWMASWTQWTWVWVNSWSLLKLMPTESVMPSNHLILCHPFLLLPSIFPSIRVFSKESALRIRWPKYWSFSFNISPSNEYSGLVSFRIDWFDLLAVQETLESSAAPQFGSISSSALSLLFMVGEGRH